MNQLRRVLGIVWVILALLVGYYGLTILGLPKLASGKTEDAVFGLIVCFVLLPVVVGGLLVFGVYALQNEYHIGKVDQDV